METSVGKKLVASAGWSIAGDVSVAVSGAVATLIAARLVPKTEIGLVGVVALMVALIETLTYSGVEQALVQRARSVDEMLDTAWTWQLGRGVLIAAVLLVAAPFVASFYDSPALTALTCAVAAQPLLRGATNIAMTLRYRDLDFRVLFFLNAGPALLRLAVVGVLGWAWRNAWALVAGLLIEQAVYLVLSYVLHPRRARLRMRLGEIRPLLGFGKWVLAATLLTYLVTRADDLFVSKAFGTAELAVYQLAFGLANTPATSISRVIGRVSFPAFARLQDDATKLRTAFLEVLRINGFWSLTAAAVLFFGFPFLPTVVGAQWRDAVYIGQVLAFGGALRSLAATGGPLFRGTGRPDLDLKMNLPRLVFLVGLLYPFSRWYGLDGVAWASLAAVATCFPVWIYGVRRQTGLRLRDVASVLGDTLLATVLTAAVFGALAWLLPANLIGLLVFCVVGPLLAFGALRAGERILRVPLLPSLSALKRI